MEQIRIFCLYGYEQVKQETFTENMFGHKQPEICYNIIDLNIGDKDIKI